MMKSHRARFGALLLSAALASTSAVACTLADPPAADVITKTYSFGPFDLEPDGTEGSRVSGWADLPKPDGDIAVKSIRWQVRDGQGNEIPSTDHRVHFHHVVAYSTKTRPDPMCRSIYYGSRFAAPGSERTPLVLPPGFAYFANAADEWTGNYDIMNLTDEPQPGIHVTYDVTYTQNRKGLLDVTPYWLDLAQCSAAGTFAVPGGGEPGSLFTRSLAFTLPRFGMVVAVRSHMHDGGVDVTLTDSRGGEICRGTAVYDDGGGDDPGGGHGHEHDSPDGHAAAGPRIKEIPLCTGLHHLVAAGEQVTLTARYHNEQALSDAMGKVLVYVADVPAPGATTTTTTRPATTRPATTGSPTTAAPTTAAPTTPAGSGPAAPDPAPGPQLPPGVAAGTRILAPPD
jgi:hypothetical protein